MSGLQAGTSSTPTHPHPSHTHCQSSLKGPSNRFAHSNHPSPSSSWLLLWGLPGCGRSASSSAKAIWAHLGLQPGAGGSLGRTGSSGGLGVSHGSHPGRPPHDGSMHALKPAGLPRLGWDPAPPPVPWPRSPGSAAEMSPVLSGRPSHHIPHHPPRQSPGSPGSTSTSQVPGPSRAAHPQGGHPCSWAGRGTGIGASGAWHRFTRSGPSLPKPRFGPEDTGWAAGGAGVSLRRVMCWRIYGRGGIQEKQVDLPAGQTERIQVREPPLESKI